MMMRNEKYVDLIRIGIFKMVKLMHSFHFYIKIGGWMCERANPWCLLISH